MNCQKKNYDTQVATNNYEKGDIIYCRDQTKTIGQCPKLKAKQWKGPYLIIEKLSELLFKIKGPRGKTTVQHHNRLKPYPKGDLPTWAVNLKKQLAAETLQKTKSMVDHADSSTQTGENLSEHCQGLRTLSGNVEKLPDIPPKPPEQF